MALCVVFGLAWAASVAHAVAPHVSLMLASQQAGTRQVRQDQVCYDGMKVFARCAEPIVARQDAPAAETERACSTCTQPLQQLYLECGYNSFDVMRHAMDAEGVLLSPKEVDAVVQRWARAQVSKTPVFV